MKKNKGFTLIELLAVIVILAIIALIATPIVLNIIGNVKKGAFARSAEGLLKSSKLYYTTAQLQPSFVAESISFNCDDNGCVSTKLDENNKPIKLDIDGQVGTGEVIINESGKITFKVSKTGYCAYKYIGESKINVIKGDCDSISIVDDSNPPKITANGNPVTTSNSIIIGYTIEENESGLKPIACTYGTTAGTYDKTDNVNASETACSINGLTKGTYYYKICATDQGMNTACLEGSATTSDIPTPIIEYKDASGNEITSTDSGYVEKDYITITFNNTGVTNANNYIKTTANTNAILGSGGALEVCGNGAHPEETCTAAGTTLDANYWYKLTGVQNATIEFTVEGELVAVTTDDNGNTNVNNAVSRHIIPTVAQIGFDNTNGYSERNCDNLECALDELNEKLSNS